MDLIFKDYFSDDSEAYQKFRPQYPPALFEYLASLTQEHERAWDCATGTGQAAISLTQYFSTVIATDASQSQIERASQQEGIIYQLAAAEQNNIESESIDIITVAQALHWFNIDRFAHEVTRVLKPDGILAVWSYNLLQIQPEINEIINDLSSTVLAPFWTKERKLVESGYKEIRLPFTELHPPRFQMAAEWNLTRLIGYLCTWSAVKKYQSETGDNPVENLFDKLLEKWGAPDHALTVSWPLAVRIWKKE